jgi:hypothetical protein
MTIQKAADIKSAPLGRWPGGMNNVDDVHELGATRETPAYLRDALNVDIDRNGKTSRRKGYKLLFGGNAHSLFGRAEFPFGLVVYNGNLCWFDESEPPPVTVLPVDPALRMAYAVLNGRIIWSNGQIRGVMRQDKSIYPLGIDTPVSQPTLGTYAGGGMDAGTYQVAITYQRDINGELGEESGAMMAGTIDVAQGQGIQLSSIPQSADPSVSFVRIYITPPNGDVLYAAQQLVAGVTEYALGKRTLGRALETMMLDRMPAGTSLCAYRGRLYSALGTRITYSDPLRYGLTSRTKNYFDFPDPVVLMEPVEDGIYVGTETQTFFLSGNDPTAFQLRPIEARGVVPFSSCQATGSDFGADYKGPVACWWNTAGNLVLGSVSGQITHLTRKALSLPSYLSGAAVLREQDGKKQVVSSMRHPTNEGVGAADYAVVKLIRNGVEIIQ